MAMLSLLRVWWWKRALNSEKLPVIERAVRSLVATEHPAVPEILRSLLGRCWPQGVHRVAVEGLVATGHPAVPDMLRPYLAPPNTAETAAGLLETGWQPPTEEERLWLLVYARQYDRAVTEFGEKSIAPLIETFESETHQRKAVADALARLGDGALIRLRKHIFSRPFLSGIWGSMALTLPSEKDVQDLLEATACLPFSGIVNSGSGEDAHGDRAKKNAIVKWLEPMKELAVPAIVPLLRSSNNNVRRLAEHALETFGWKPEVAWQRLAFEFAALRRNNLPGSAAEVVQFLVEAFAVDDENLTIRLDGIDKDWRRMGAAEAAIPFLAEAARGPDAKAAQGAIRGLAEIRGDQALALIREALQAADPLVRANAATVLGDLLDHCSVNPLLKLLDDEVAFVRECAARSLGKLGDPLAVDGLAGFVDAADEVPEAGVRALSLFVDPRAAKALVRALGRCRHQGQESWVLEALWQIRASADDNASRIAEVAVASYAERNVARLIRTLEDPVLRGSLGERERIMSDWDIERTRVVNVIALIGKPAASAAEPLLRLVLPDRRYGRMRWELNLAAARALVRIGEVDRLLAKVTGWAQGRAGTMDFGSFVEILGEIGAPAANVLRSFLTHEDPSVRELVRVQLDRLGYRDLPS